MHTPDEFSKPARIGLADDVQAVLIEKIKRLESELERATAIAREAQGSALGNVLRPLPRYEAILLYFGDASLEQYSATLREQFSGETADDILRNALSVDSIPLSAGQKQALRLALTRRNSGLAG